MMVHTTHNAPQMTRVATGLQKRRFSPRRRSTVETSFIAYLAEGLGIERVLELYPHLDREAVVQAAKFEGAEPLAA